jgi:hypothetical protein
MENIWTKVLVETSNDGGETWKKDILTFTPDTDIIKEVKL